MGDVATLNVTRGCAGACTFCYARCYVGAPSPGTVLVYHDLPRLLRQQLDSPRRKARPRFVVLNTASDCLLGGAAVSQVAQACVEILLRRGIGISIATRGAPSEELLDLLGHHAALVQITVPLTSLSPEYHEQWEPGATTAQQRLFTIQQLQERGIMPAVRVEPIIPFVNDSTSDLRQLLSALGGLNISRVNASFLHLRPGVAEQIKREAPADARRIVLGSFPSLQSGRPPRFDHLVLKQAQASLRRMQRVGREVGVRVSACHCQNPGLPAGRCPVVPPELPPQPLGHQSELFEPTNE